MTKFRSEVLTVSIPDDTIAKVRQALLNGDPVPDRHIQVLLDEIDVRDDIIDRQSVYMNQLSRIRRKLASDSLP